VSLFVLGMTAGAVAVSVFVATELSRSTDSIE